MEAPIRRQGSLMARREAERVAGRARLQRAIRFLALGLALLCIAGFVLRGPIRLALALHALATAGNRLEREGALASLGRIDHPRAREALLDHARQLEGRFLKDLPPEAQIADPLLARLTAPEAARRVEAAYALYWLRHRPEVAGDPRVRAATLRLGADPDTQVRLYALLVLSDWAWPEAVPLFASAIGADHAALRVVGAEGLGRTRPPGTRDLLLPLLSDKDRDVRRTAAFALADLGALEVVPVLRALVLDALPPGPGRNREGRIEAIRALGRVGGPEAVEALGAASRDLDPDLRLETVMALRATGLPAAVPPLLSLLEDTEAPVRLDAVAALGALRDPRATAPLVARLRRSEGPGETEAISDALAAITGQAIEVPGRGDPAARETAIAAWERWLEDGGR